MKFGQFRFEASAEDADDNGVAANWDGSGSPGKADREGEGRCAFTVRYVPQVNGGGKDAFKP